MRVFVSSTYRYLAEHREVLRLALETSKYDFHGMEHFAAQNLPPLAVCLAELEKCDIYVGIMGGLYGSCPPGRVLSYTELEFRRAVQLDMYQIWLMLDDNANVKPNHIEQDAEKIERLSRFRERVKNYHTCQTFSDPNEAAWKVLAALRTYEVRKADEDAANDE